MGHSRGHGGQTALWLSGTLRSSKQWGPTLCLMGSKHWARFGWWAASVGHNLLVGTVFIHGPLKGDQSLVQGGQAYARGRGRCGNRGTAGWKGSG